MIGTIISVRSPKAKKYKGAFVNRKIQINPSVSSNTESLSRRIVDLLEIYLASENHIERKLYILGSGDQMCLGIQELG